MRFGLFWFSEGVTMCPNNALQPTPGGAPVCIKASHGFTVLELLVVIAFIAILAALLFPAISSAKAKAKRTVCMNHLRQINLGLRMYSDDSGDASPHTPGTSSSPSMENFINFTGYKKLMKSN